MAFSDMLINTCTVSRYTDGGIDDYGHLVKTWANHLTGQSCRLQAQTAREVITDKEVVLADYELFLPPVSITERDRVTINGITYEVLAVKPVQDGSAVHHLECDLRTLR